MPKGTGRPGAVKRAIEDKKLLRGLYREENPMETLGTGSGPKLSKPKLSYAGGTSFEKSAFPTSPKKPRTPKKPRSY